MLNATYVVPLRWNDITESSDMTSYLRWLSERLEVIVVDGSPLDVFEHHAEVWTGYVKHVRPDPDLRFVNGKVNGVTTGVRAAGYDKVVIADDDIRYDGPELTKLVSLLDDHDLVIAQSYFRPSPWHAKWDEARILLNRAFGTHFPASMGFRRSMFLAIDGYDGDVLFENLELIRSLRFAGARVADSLDLFVAHRPPTRAAFWSQRVRQAYDDLTLPHRMALWLSLLPLAAFSIARGRSGRVVGAAAGSVAIAEIGRRRAGGTSVYPASTPLFAPLWLAERAVGAWVAVWYRLRHGGVPYRDGVLSRAATPRKALRARIAQRLDHRDPAP